MDGRVSPRSEPASVVTLALGLALGLAAAAAAAVEVRWQVDFEPSRSTPVLADGVVYVGSNDGAVYAFEAETGRQLWRHLTGEKRPTGHAVLEGSVEEVAASLREAGEARVSATPVVAGGAVYVGSEDRSFYSLDAATGELIWSHATGGKITGEALVGDGGVYFVSEDGMLHALDAESGAERWTLETWPERGSWLVRDWEHPTLHERTIFTTVRQGVPEQSSGLLLAIDGETGERRWRVPVAGIGASRPTVAGDLVLFGVQPASGRGAGSLLYAVDRASGAVRLRFEVPFRIIAPAAVLGDLAVIATTGGAFAVDLERGAELWGFQGPVSSSKLRIDDRSVYLQTHRGVRDSDHLRAFFAPPKFSAVHGLDLATGRPRWSVRSKRPDFWPVLLDDGLLYVLESSTILRALDAAGGREVWSHEFPTRVNGGLFGRDGAILAVTRLDRADGGGHQKGKLICLRPGKR